MKEIGLDNNDVYFYVVTTVKNNNGLLVQQGSGPNLDGGIITLCTCKHYMRALLSSDKWQGKWVAGFTGIGRLERRHFLIYLMKVGIAFESHYDLWHCSAIPAETKAAKRADLNRLGDIFMPKPKASRARFVPESYYPPVVDHPHADKDAWHNDVDYCDPYGRRAALLVGENDSTFVWSKPIIHIALPIRRRHKRLALSDFLSILRS
jgi:hypothetical protein